MKTTLKQNARKVVLALVALIMAGATAEAVPLTFVEVTGDLNDYISVDIPAHGTTPAYTYAGDTDVGFAAIKVGNGPVVDSFCIDPYDPSIAKSENYTAVNLSASPVSTFGNVAMNASAAVTIEKLWAMYYTSALSSVTVAATLQEAIWKAIAESNGGTVTGVEYESQANAMLVDTQSYTGGLPPLFAWSNSSYQDYIGVPDGGSTMALLGLSLSGVAFIRRKYFPRKSADSR
jgi:hypothetical protein